MKNGFFAGSIPGSTIVSIPLRGKGYEKPGEETIGIVVKFWTVSIPLRGKGYEKP